MIRDNLLSENVPAMDLEQEGGKTEFVERNMTKNTLAEGQILIVIGSCDNIIRKVSDPGSRGEEWSHRLEPITLLVTAEPPARFISQCHICWLRSKGSSNESHCIYRRRSPLSVCVCVQSCQFSHFVAKTKDFVVKTKDFVAKTKDFVVKTKDFW